MFKKKDLTQDKPRGAKVKFLNGSGSQVSNPTCATFGKRQYRQWILGTGSFFGCGK